MDPLIAYLTFLHGGLDREPLLAFAQTSRLMRKQFRRACRVIADGELDGEPMKFVCQLQHGTHIRPLGNRRVSRRIFHFGDLMKTCLFKFGRESTAIVYKYWYELDPIVSYAFYAYSVQNAPELMTGRKLTELEAIIREKFRLKRIRIEVSPACWKTYLAVRNKGKFTYIPNIAKMKESGQPVSPAAEYWFERLKEL